MTPPFQAGRVGTVGTAGGAEHLVMRPQDRRQVRSSPQDLGPTGLMRRARAASSRIEGEAQNDLSGAVREAMSTTRSPRLTAARRALFTVSLLSGRRAADHPAKEPNQEPTQADFRRRPATPGD